MSDTVSAISSVGFPIVACLILFYFNKIEIENLKKSIDNNTKVLESLQTIIKGLKK